MIFPNAQSAVDFLFSKVKGPIRAGTPLGLGKPNNLLNLLYDQCKSGGRSLEIYTALSLAVPEAKSFYEERFYGPFLERHFGKNYPRLHYDEDQKKGRLPANIKVHEFYFQAGKYKGVPSAQQDYISLNYTHAARGIFDRGINVVLQMVSRGPNGKYSLSCNPDLTLDLVDLCREAGRELYVIGVVHADLPYLGGDAEVNEDFFTGIIENEAHHELFALPRTPIDAVSHRIGLFASSLIADDGTLQIGIGALSDALVYSTLLRHQNNEQYRAAALSPAKLDTAVHAEPFTKGLYGTSEMVMDGFMHLRKAGILTREVRDGGAKIFLHGAFFLGAKPFYEWLRTLSPADFSGLAMTRVSKVNDLYDADEMALRRQRKNARFFNTCMTVTYLGGACADTTNDGQVVSGVGGQYNFVAMSHELPDSISVLMLKSTRFEKSKRRSNITAEGGHQTISRHLRDVVITEYGVANLRGKTDQECIEAMIAISDAEFQEELATQAKAAGKLRQEYRVPAAVKNNTPAQVRTALAKFQPAHFPAYPFGSDFTETEQKLVNAFGKLKKSGLLGILGTAARGLRASSEKHKTELERMSLLAPRGLKERFFARLLLGALEI